MVAGLETQAALDAGDTDKALTLARDYMDGPKNAGSLNGARFGEALSVLASQGDEAAGEELDRLRWLLLRWSPRDDSGVVYAAAQSTEVWAESLYSVVPMLVLTRDFAPADMQYRMHREHLLDADSGRYRERSDLVSADPLRAAATARGSGWAAAAMARALRLGAEDTPSEMRGRWQRETSSVLDACAGADEPEAAAMLAYAAFTGVADGWLAASYTGPADVWAGFARKVTATSGRAFVQMAHAARARR